MNYKLVSFEEIFKIPGVEKVVIPKIQRDYVQGRKSKSIQRGREQFLESIFNVIKDTDQSNIMKLDFVYGSIIDGEFIPLDGQQRLTTLFLFYLYIGLRNNIHYDFLSKFMYETRESSNNFCKKICTELSNIDWSKLQESKISDYIREQKWFMYDWNIDPTITSMLTVLDDIHLSYNKLEPKQIEVIDSNLNKIKFYFMSISEFGSTDDIYIRMNSRGKPLTDFELFKSELDKVLKRCDDTTTIELVDQEWTNLLWPYACDSKTFLIDKFFINYFKFICSVIFYKNKEYYESKNKLDKVIFKDFQSFDEYELLNICFPIDNEVTKDNIKLLNKYFNVWIPKSNPTESNPKEYINSIFNQLYYYIEPLANPITSVKNKNFQILATEKDYNLFNKAISGKLSYKETLYLYFIIEFLSLIRKDGLNDIDFRIKDFKIKYRCLKNLFNYSDITTIKAGQIFNFIDKLNESNLSACLSYCLSEQKNIDNNPFCQSKLQEEICIENQLSNDEQRRMIYNLEDSSYLNGQIAILAYKNENGKDSLNIEQCCNLAETFCSLFHPNDINITEYGTHLVNISRALFTYGDYGVPENGWRYLYGSNNRTTWTELFNMHRIPYKKHLYRLKKTSQYLHSLLEELKCCSLQNLIENYLKKNQEFTYRYYFVNPAYNKFAFKWHGKCLFNQPKVYEDLENCTDLTQLDDLEHKQINIVLMNTEYRVTSTYYLFEEQINQFITDENDKIKIKWVQKNTEGNIISCAWEFYYKNRFTLKDNKMVNSKIENILIDFSFNKDMIKEAVNKLKTIDIKFNKELQ